MDVATAAVAYRVRLDDISRLENGDLNPRHWEAERRLFQATSRWTDWTIERSPQTPDGYFDRRRAQAEVGPRAADMMLGKHMGATRTTWRKFATTWGVDFLELMQRVEELRDALRKHQTDLWLAWTHPYKLQTWDQVAALEPCPGCGRPWLSPDTPATAQAFQEAHEQCKGGQSRLGSEGGPHCHRCCGMPPMSPQVMGGIRTLLEGAAQQRTVEPDLEAEVARNADKIARAERQLAKLRQQHDALTARLPADTSSDPDPGQ